MTVRALVTGASGFVGQFLLEELAARGIEAVCVGRTRPPHAADFHRLPDDADPAALGALLAHVRPAMVFHLAGVTNAPSLAEVYRVNVLLAAALLDAGARLDAPPVMVFAGTAAEYGDPPADGAPVTEGAPCRPHSIYGISKLAQTLHVLAAARNGAPALVARLFNVVGAGMGEHLALGNFAAQIARMGPEGGALVTGPLDAERDFIGAGEVARCLVDLASTPRAIGRVVNICSGEARRMSDLVDLLVAASDRPVRLQLDARRGSMANTVQRFIGDPGLLRSLGVVPPTLDVATIGADLLAGAVLASRKPMH